MIYKTLELLLNQFLTKESVFQIQIQTFDIGLGREETAMMITLHDYERRPLAEPGVDIKVEVTCPGGKKSRAQVLDLTDSEGAYKVLFQVKSCLYSVLVR